MPEATREGVSGAHDQDERVRASTIRLIRGLAGAALLLPLALFVLASALSYRSKQELAN